MYKGAWSPKTLGGKRFVLPSWRVWRAEGRPPPANNVAFGNPSLKIDLSQWKKNFALDRKWYFIYINKEYNYKSKTFKEVLNVKKFFGFVLGKTK